MTEQLRGRQGRFLAVDGFLDATLATAADVERIRLALGQKPNPPKEAFSAWAAINLQPISQESQ